MPWPSKFDAVVRMHLRLLGPDQELTEDLIFANHGLDSLGMLSLLAALEHDLDVVFPDDRLTLTMFETPKSLWAAFQAVM